MSSVRGGQVANSSSGNEVGGITTPTGALSKLRDDPMSVLSGSFALEDIARMSQTARAADPTRTQILGVSDTDRARQLSEAHAAQQMAMAAQNRAAPQTAIPTDFRQQQMGLARMLGQQAQGLGPSPAQAAAQQQLVDARQQAASLAASQPGASPGLALRGALQSQEQLGAQSAGALAQARAQEQLNAQQALAGLSGTARGQDIQGAELRTQAQLQQAQMNDVMTRALRGEATERELADFQAQVGLQQQRGESAMQHDRLASDIAKFNAEQADKESSGMMSALGTGIGALFS